MVQVALYVICMLNEFIGALCITGQNLTNEAEELLNIINTSNWYENSAITKNDFLIITLEAQRPVRLSAGKFININMETCMATFKTIFSYYMFLLSVSEPEN